MAGLEGVYEYDKPGDKSLQTLTLKSGGVATYTEKGETSMERWNSTGSGSWSVQGSTLKVILNTLSKEMKFKVKPLVPGIGDGTSVKNNVALPITLSDIKNAPDRPVKNKWRKKQN